MGGGGAPPLPLTAPTLHARGNTLTPKTDKVLLHIILAIAKKILSRISNCPKQHFWVNLGPKSLAHALCHVKGSHLAAAA